MSKDGGPALEYPSSSVVLFSLWYRTMPDWVREACLNDPTVNRVLKECALRETTKEEMQWRLCAALYEQRNQFRDTMLAEREKEGK